MPGISWRQYKWVYRSAQPIENQEAGGITRGIYGIIPLLKSTLFPTLLTVARTVPENKTGVEYE
jgi:hypothetical protein